MKTATEEIRLNLGSRNFPVEGFLNMDMDAHPGVDITGDVRDLSRFSDESVIAICASHILEHFPHVETADVLREWYRVLAPGGTLYVAVPDFRRAIELYERAGLEDWIVYFLWGEQSYKTAFHYTAFDDRRLERILKNAGFKEVSQVEWFPFDVPGAMHLHSTLDDKLISLNMVAVK